MQDQIDQLPEAQQAMMQQMMEGQMQGIQEMLNQAMSGIVVETTSLVVNQGPPGPD